MKTKIQTRMKSAIIYIPEEKHIEMLTTSPFSGMDDLAAICIISVELSEENKNINIKETIRNIFSKAVENVNMYAKEKGKMFLSEVPFNILSEGMNKQGSFSFFPEYGELKMNDSRSDKRKTNPIVIGTTLLYIQLISKVSQIKIPININDLNSEIDIFIDRVNKKFNIRQGE